MPQKALVSVVTTLLCISMCHAVEIRLFNTEGLYFAVEMLKGCFNFTEKWSKYVVSMDNTHECLAIYKDLDCKGTPKLLGEGGHTLRNIGFDNGITSMELCSEAQEKLDKEKGSDPYAEYKPEELWQVAIDEHNRFRRMHGSPDLKGNEDIHIDAQNWVDELIEKHEFKSTTMNMYGNNIGTSFRKNKLDALRECIRRWYSRVKDYDWNNPGYVGTNGANVGSFIALIWKATTEIGVGIGFNHASDLWIVNIFYFPPPQHTGFEENILQKGAALPQIRQHVILQQDISDTKFDDVEHDNKEQHANMEHEHAKMEHEHDDMELEYPNMEDEHDFLDHEHENMEHEDLKYEHDFMNYHDNMYDNMEILI